MTSISILGGILREDRENTNLVTRSNPGATTYSIKVGPSLASMGRSVYQPYLPCGIPTRSWTAGRDGLATVLLT